MCEYECFVWYVGCSGCVFDVLVGVMLQVWQYVFDVLLFFVIFEVVVCVECQCKCVVVVFVVFEYVDVLVLVVGLCVVCVCVECGVLVGMVFICLVECEQQFCVVCCELWLCVVDSVQCVDQVVEWQIVGLCVECVVVYLQCEICVDVVVLLECV